MITTPPSRRAFAAAVLVGVLTFGLTGIAQSADDLAWQRFLAWLRVAPPVSGPLEILQGYQSTLATTGRTPSG